MHMQKIHSPKSLEELKKVAAPILDVNREHRQSLKKLDRLALWITNHVGTMGFFSIIFAWTLLWLLWNSLTPVGMRFDPFPAFVLWLFISNMIQLMLLPLLMIGQNLQSRHAESKAKAEYEMNVSEQRNLETIIMHLENQNKALEEIVSKINK